MMTRLLNRRGLEEQLSPIWQRLCNDQETIAFVCFDLDRLKKINDQFGHPAGDFAIRLVADAIRKAAPKEAIMARMGGDEFLATAMTDAPSEVLEQIRSRSAEWRGAYGETLSLSVGYAAHLPASLTTNLRFVSIIEKALKVQTHR